MTLALIRFVNSLLDPLQKRDKSLPLSVLANDAGLPTVFVEIRHWGTHENNLPGAEILRDMGIRALEWLYRNFWNRRRESEGVIAGWKSGVVDVKEVVDSFARNRHAAFEDLFVEIATNDDYGVSQSIFDPLMSVLSVQLSAFPVDFIHYVMEILTTTSNGMAPQRKTTFNLDPLTTISTPLLDLKYPETLISWTMSILNRPRTFTSSLTPDFVSVARQCIHHPNSL